MTVRRPSVAAFIATSLAFVLLCGLGTWQVQRLAWKTALIRDLDQARQGDPALSVDDLRQAAARHAYFLHGHVAGRFRSLQSMLVGPRTHDGAVGFHLYTPLVTPSGAILVNRGWVPPDFKDDDGAGIVAVTGLARLPDRANWFTPANQPDQRRWFSVDLEAAEKLSGLRLAPFVLYAEGPAQAAPYPLDARWLPPNNHLQYAVFWFGMALALLVMTGSRLMRA